MTSLNFLNFFNIESVNSLAARWAEMMWAVSWQFCVLGFVVLAAHWLLRRAAPNWRYWLWQILAIKLLLMPFWTATAPWKWPVSTPNPGVIAATSPAAPVHDISSDRPLTSDALPASSIIRSSRIVPSEGVSTRASAPIAQQAVPKTLLELASNRSSSIPSPSKPQKTAPSGPQHDKSVASAVTRTPSKRTTVFDQPSQKLIAGEKTSEPAAQPVISATARQASKLTTAAIPSTPVLTWLAWLMLIWTFGVLTLASRIIWQGVSLSRRLRKTAPGDADLVERVRAAGAKLGMTRIPEVRVIDLDVSPFVCGLWRSRLFVPNGLAQSFTAEQLDLVLLHELAHVRRQDLIWGWIPEIGKILFFFHPVVHFLCAQVRFERELACDQLAMVSSGRDAATYADTLVRVVGQFSGSDSFQLAANSPSFANPVP